MKLTLRRGVEDELYLDNLGSRIIEDSPNELKIKPYQGGEIVLVRTAAPVGPQAAIRSTVKRPDMVDPLVPAPRTRSTIFKLNSSLLDQGLPKGGYSSNILGVRECPA